MFQLYSTDHLCIPILFLLLHIICVHQAQFSSIIIRSVTPSRPISFGHHASEFDIAISRISLILSLYRCILLLLQYYSLPGVQKHKQTIQNEKYTSEQIYQFELQFILIYNVYLGESIHFESINLESINLETTFQESIKLVSTYTSLSGNCIF